MGKPIDNPFYNIFIIFICGVVYWVASINSIKLSNKVSLFEFIYLPLIITAIAILIYLGSRLLTKKKNWVITIIGSIVLLLLGILTYFRLIYN